MKFWNSLPDESVVGEFRCKRNREDSIDVGIHKIILAPTQIGERRFYLSVEERSALTTLNKTRLMLWGFNADVRRALGRWVIIAGGVFAAILTSVLGHGMNIFRRKTIFQTFNSCVIWLSDSYQFIRTKHPTPIAFLSPCVAKMSMLYLCGFLK